SGLDCDCVFFFSSRRRHTRSKRDWSSDVCSSDLADIDFVHELGADRAIDYQHEQFEKRVRDVDLVLDLVAGDTQERSWQVLKKRSEERRVGEEERGRGAEEDEEKQESEAEYKERG